VTRTLLVLVGLALLTTACGSSSNTSSNLTPISVSRVRAAFDLKGISIFPSLSTLPRGTLDWFSFAPAGTGLDLDALVTTFATVRRARLFARTDPFCPAGGCLRVRNVVLKMYPPIKARYRQMFTSALRKLGTPTSQ
jgi:hypothetical protein